MKSVKYNGKLIKVKDGVTFHDSGRWPIILAAVASAFNAHGAACIVTSGTDGHHKIDSKHYTGDALDFRIRHVDQYQLRAIMIDIDIALPGKIFDVVLESDHIHVEYDPEV